MKNTKPGFMGMIIGKEVRFVTGMKNTNSAKSCQKEIFCKEYRGRGLFKKCIMTLSSVPKSAH